MLSHFFATQETVSRQTDDTAMRQKQSDYMQWAKLHSKARFNLATSGVGAYPLEELPVTIDQLEINGDNTYGYAPLQQAIANEADVDPACVVEAAGTSMANYLAMAALIEPGDEVLIEHPDLRTAGLDSAISPSGKRVSRAAKKTISPSTPPKSVAPSLPQRS